MERLEYEWDFCKKMALRFCHDKGIHAGQAHEKFVLFMVKGRDRQKCSKDDSAAFVLEVPILIKRLIMSDETYKKKGKIKNMFYNLW